MNKIGAMHGNKETDLGRAMEKKHEAKGLAKIVAPKPQVDNRGDYAY